MGSSASAAAFKKANASNVKQRRKTQILPVPEPPGQPLPVLPSKVDGDPVPPTQSEIDDQGADHADKSLPSELPEDEVDEIPDTFDAESEIENEEETEVINTKEVEQERALRKNKKERAIQVLAHEKQAEASSKLLAMSSELIREQDNEVAMEAVASQFISRRKTQKNPFKYDEFKSIERAYRRSLVAKQQEAIRRSQNQAKDDKQEAVEMASFLRIHKAISDLEGWGPGLRLSCQQGEWTVVGISQNSGASVSGIRLGDKLVSVGGQVVSGMQFDRIRSLLLGPKDTNVFVTVLKKKFLWSSNQQYVLLRSLPSASFDFSSKDVIEKTLAKASFIEDLEAAAKNAEDKLRDEMNAALAAEEEARNATALALLNLHNHFVSAPHLDDAAISLVHTTITSNVKNMGMPSFVISVHNRSISTEIKDFSMSIADQLAVFIRSFHMEPVINIIQDYKRDVMSKSTWRSSIEQGASTNGIPVCVLIWDLDHWNIWQLWMQRHHNAMTETNRSIEVYRKKLLNFDDDDFIQEALHIFSAKNAAQVSRIFVFVEKNIEPSALLNLVRMDLMQILFQVNLQQVVFVFRENIRIDLSIFQRMAYTTVSSFFQQLTLYSFTQYFSNLLSLLLKSVTNITASIQDRGPDIRKLLCSGKSVITSHFIPTKQFSFSAEQIVQSHESLNEKYLLKQPQHVILHSMIQNWPNNPVSTKPGKKLFVFTPEISGFSSALDWISESLRARPHGLEDIVPILIRIPKRFQRTGLAESQSVIFALNAVFEDTLSAPPFNFLGARDPNLEVSTVSPEQLMESFSKMLSVACKQLNLRFLIMFDNIHYINFDADNMGCIQWTLSRMPENVRIVYPFLLNSQMHLSLKSHLDLMVKKSLAGSLDIELLQGLEYRQIPVFTSHQRYFFGCFVKSGTLCQVLAEKLCEDYFAWYLHINPNMETHIWLLISTGYVMVHHLWHIAIKPIEIFLPSGLNSLIAIIVKDFSSILSGSTMLTAARIMTTANCGITITEIVKVMMLLCGHRDEVFKRKFEYHQSCRLLFETPGQAQALQRFCCIFARMEGQGFSTSSLLMLNAHVDRILNDVILEILGPLPEIPSYDSVKQVIFEFVVFSCNLKSTASGFDFKSESSVQGHQLRQFSIMTDFALSLKDKRTFVLALTSSRIVHARIVMGCIDWVIGNILQALRMAVDFDESDLSQLFDLFRSLISHKSRAPLLRIQPDLYFSIMSTTPSKEYLCQRTLDILEQSGAPWLRHINKQTYFPFPINNLADLPTEASAVATSKRGHMVAAGDFSGNVAVWAVSSSDLLCIFKSHSQAITGIFFSSLDYIIVSCSVDFSININSVYSSSVLTTITPHTQPISCMDVWLKESVSFATVSRDGFAAITTLNMRAIAARSSAWTAIKDGTTQTEFKEEELGALLLQPSSVTFTFQVSSFEVKAENVHTNFVNCIACHPVDTGVCATGSRDSSIIVWKVDFVSSTSVCMFRYLGHNHWIMSLDWMPVGYTILSSSMSSAVHVWRVPWEEYVEIKIGSNESSGDFQADELLMHSTVDRNQLTDPKISRLRNGDDTHVIVDGDDDDFSEFDGARIFMEREEKEITKVSIAAGSLPVVIHAASETNPKNSAAEGEAVATKTYTSCHAASIAVDLKDAKFPWKTKHSTKQYASNARFLGTESMWLLSIENESLTFDAKNRILTSLFRGHTDKINAITFTPLLDIFFTASSDAFVKAWDISRAPELVLLEHSSLASITAIVFGRQRSDLFRDAMECTFFYGCSDGSLGAIDCHKGGLKEPMKSTDFAISNASVKHNYGISCMSYFHSYKPSLPEIVASGDENGGIMLWNATERRHLRTLSTTRLSSVMACQFFLPVVAFGEEVFLNLFSITGDAFCVVWNAETGSAVRFVHLAVPTVSYVHICTKCSISALRHPGSSSVTLLSHETLAYLGCINLTAYASETQQVKSLTVSIDGDRCAVGSSTGDMYLVGAHSRQLIAVGKHHNEEVRLLLWTSFMNRLVSVSADMTLAFWDGSIISFDEKTADHQHAVCRPILFRKLDAHVTVIKECTDVPWFMATLDDQCTSCIWNIATADIVCKIAIHNSSPAMAFCGRAVCYGNSEENTPIVFSLQDSDILGMVRSKSSLLTDPNDRDTLRRERKAMQEWRAAFRMKR